MYRIFADATLIYDSTLEDYHIGKGEVTLEMDKSGSFVFSLYPIHPFYDSFVELRTVVKVYKDGRIVFRGRVLNTTVDYRNVKTFTCEGELGFLQDSIVRPYSLTGTPAELFKHLIDAHNAQVDEFKRFNVGTVTVEGAGIVYSNTEYETGMSNLSKLMEALGGHIYITHGDEGTEDVPTIHYLADFPKTATQGIEFGVNLKDYVKTVKAEEIATALIPLGATVDDGNSDTADQRLTIASVNDGLDYVHSAAGVALRGWVFKTVSRDDVTDPASLKEWAEELVEQVATLGLTVELTAVDMHFLDRTVDSYGVCEYIPVSSAPHGFAATLLCYKQTLNLLKPDNDTVVLGSAYATLTSTNVKVLSAASTLIGLRASVNSLSKELATVIVRLDGMVYPTITILVTDTLDELDALLTTLGVLVVDAQPITETGATLTASSTEVEVVYALSGDLAAARTVSVNGTSLGSVSTTGQTVTTKVKVSNGDIITIDFTA